MTIAIPPVPNSIGEDIAIVGMSCMFPGADNLQDFWQNIVNKKDCISDAPPDWQPEIFYDESGTDANRSYTRSGGFLGDLSRFDPLKYDVVPGSIEGSEPDHFIALRCAYEALADAGCPDVPINRERTGVIVGRGLFVNRGWVTVFQRTVAVDQMIRLLRELEPQRSESDLAFLRKSLLDSLPPANADTFPGLVHSALVGRIANRLNLNGPAFTVDAACAATLIAVEHGVSALRAGHCDAVLVGGSQVSIPAPVAIMFCQIGALSRKGLIAPFSAEANGTLLGQGCGMLVLKRRSDAERDGSRIYAVIKGVATSSDGKGAGMLAPNTAGQQLAIRRAYERSGLDASTVSLIEAHGTGIPMGDATELQSLNACFGDAQISNDRVALGSVKSMIGHLIPAAGAASMIKTALALYHRTLPPTLHAGEPHPKLGLDRTPFYLCSEPQPWINTSVSSPLRAGINAFGFGGANAHAILEAVDTPAPFSLEREWPCELVVLRASDRHLLARKAEALNSWLDGTEGLKLLEIAATCAQDEGDSVLAIVARTTDDLRRKLAHAAKLLNDETQSQIQDRNGIFWFAEPLARTGKIAFMFPGEGSQYPGMHAALCRAFPAVRRQFELTAQALATPNDPHSMARIFFPQPTHRASSEVSLFEMENAVAAVTTSGRGLLDLLKSFGVQPDAVVGHSSGEFAACLAAGAFAPIDEEQLKETIVNGAASTARVARDGDVPKVMLLSVGGATPGAVEQVLREAGGQITLAMDNCPNQQILLGAEDIMAQALKTLQGKGGFCEVLPWDRPYHSAEFAPACGAIEEYVRSIPLQAPVVDLWSCTTASRFPDDIPAIGDLMVRQWHNPVRFRETVAAMHDDGIRLFVEVGPRSNLCSFVSDILTGKSHCAVPMDVRSRNDLDQLCRAIGLMAAHGVPVQLDRLYAARSPSHLDFAVPAPAPKQLEPQLRLDLPFVKISDEARVRFHQKPADQAFAVKGNSTGSPQIENIVGSPTTSLGKDNARKQALADFQHTARLFLEVQNTILGKRAVGVKNETSPMSAVPTAQVVAVRESEVATLTPNAIQQQMGSVIRNIHSSSNDSMLQPIAANERAPVPNGFVDAVLEFETGRRIVAECELDVARHPFLLDHTFFGRGLSHFEPELTAMPVTPLAVTLEIICQVAARLRPGDYVSALSDVNVSRWLAMVTPTRRVRVTAEIGDDGIVQAVIMESDREGMSSEVARAKVEFSVGAHDLGPARLADPGVKPPPWRREDIYGKILYHGPSFQGLEDVTYWSPTYVAASVNSSPPMLIGATLAIPAQLIDNASQVPPLVHGNYWETDSPLCKLAFPNRFDRLEFTAPFPHGERLLSVAEILENSTVLRSNTEFTTRSGRVVLRYWGKTEEIVHFPRSLYEYCFHPCEVWANDDVTALFADVPGIEGCAIARTRSAGFKLFVNNMWSSVLARLVLDADERKQMDSFAKTPVAVAHWLFGRIAAKDAVRMLKRLRCTMVEVPIRSADSGQPRVILENAESVLLSLAHKDLCGIAVAGDHQQLCAVGIDMEPELPMEASVIEDAFSPQEREIIEACEVHQGRDSHCWYRAAWCAKEAIGKALGLGLPQGPRGVEILSMDLQEGLVNARVHGALVEPCLQLSGSVIPASKDSESHVLSGWVRFDQGYVIGLCLLPRRDLNQC